MKKEIKRNAKIIELRKKGLTLESIGRLYSISRERVRQIVERWG